MGSLQIKLVKMRSYQSPRWLSDGRSPGGGNGTPLQYPCLKNPMDRGAWWAIVHRVTKSWTHWGFTDTQRHRGGPKSDMTGIFIWREKFTHTHTHTHTEPCNNRGRDCCCCLVTKSCPILCDPMDCSPPGSLSMGVFSQEYCSWEVGLPFPSPGDLPNPQIELVSPAGRD